MSAYQRIVAAVDFSECSAAALEQAGRIASWGGKGGGPGASIDAVFVIEPIIYDVSAPALMVPVPTPADLSGDAEQRWRGFALQAHNREHMRLHTPVGQPVGEVAHLAGERKADLVVVGAHSSIDAARGVGSVASGIARAAPCPVLLTCERHRGPFRSVIAAVDFSPASRVAIEHAARFAAQDGARLTLLHVYRDPWATSKRQVEMAANLPDLREHYRQGVVARLQGFAAPLAHELGALKAHYETFEHENHARGIVAFARHNSADLVVLGARGHSRLRELIFGTTAERVVREAESSVLIVR
jgi:nucleotide-binding universal stress UspA family protein